MNPLAMETVLTVRTTLIVLVNIISTAKRSFKSFEGMFRRAAITHVFLDV
jgi:hypothetical protein